MLYVLCCCFGCACVSFAFYWERFFVLLSVSSDIVVVAPGKRRWRNLEVRRRTLYLPPRAIKEKMPNSCFCSYVFCCLVCC